MSDQFNAYVEIGDPLRRSRVEDFLEAISEDCMSTDWDGPEVTPDDLKIADAVLKLYARSSPDEVLTFCRRYGLFFRYEWEHYEGNGGMLLDLGCKINDRDILGYHLGGEIGTEPCLGAHLLRQLGSYEAIMARLDRLTAALPKFEIVEG